MAIANPPRVPRPPARGPRALVGIGFAALVLAPVALLALPGCRPAAGPSPAPSLPIPVLKPVSVEELDQYAGSQECISCHPDYAGQLQTHHALTLANVSAEVDGPRFQRPSGLKDNYYDVTYTTRLKGSECVLEATSGKHRASIRAEYAFGSGNRGVTYLGRFDGEPVELRLSYYRDGGRWHFTPGQPIGAPIQTPVGRSMTPELVEQCFQCHVTALATRDGKVDPERSIFGVGCESCHGPGRAHIEAARRGDRNLLIARLSDQRERLTEELCGQCHRTPDNAMGATPTPMDESQLARLQSVAMVRSDCYRKSAGKLSCVTCHDPHRNADSTTDLEYNQKCVSCHTPAAAGHVACPKEPAGDCVTCHMPRQTVDIPTSPKFRNHWIKVWSEDAKRKKEQP
ncbi:MAG: multiheme c-type cytochrome [Armatimonadota bacterium]